MHCRLVAPREVEAEGERLLAEWYNLPEEERPDLGEYLEAHCSEAAKAYMRECNEIRASLKPGEYV